MISGDKIYIDAVTKEDLPQLMFWRNLPEYRRYFREYRELNLEMQEKWYNSKVLNDTSTEMFSIRLKGNNELIGCCGLCYINWIHRNADLSLYIGWKKSYIDDEGYANEACKLLFDYGFQELGLQKIWTEIYCFDDKKFELYRKLGFQKDGELRNQYFHDGKWWNSYILSLLKNDWGNSNG